MLAIPLGLKLTYRVAMIDEDVPKPVVHNSTPSQFPSARIVQRADARLDRLY
jgi:hypothetical protein